MNIAMLWSIASLFTASLGSLLSTVFTLSNSIQHITAISQSRDSPRKFLSSAGHMPEVDLQDSSSLMQRALTPCVTASLYDCVIYTQFCNAVGDVTIYSHTCDILGTINDIPAEHEEIDKNVLPFPITITFENDGALNFWYYDGDYTTNTTSECETDMTSSGEFNVICRKEFFCPDPGT
jgi:hypothetical protein